MDMNLHEYRKFRDISVKKGSEEIGISRQHIYDIEKGKSFPSRKLCIKICKWSDGLVSELELLFPHLTKSAKIITLNSKIQKKMKGEMESANPMMHGSCKNEEYRRVRCNDQ